MVPPGGARITQAIENRVELPWCGFREGVAMLVGLDHLVVLVEFRVGPNELVVTVDSPEDDVEKLLETSGSGPFAVELPVFDGGWGELDLELIQGVSLRLG
jgi:hypothetical protein